jgi:hypothetical protein
MSFVLKLCSRGRQYLLILAFLIVFQPVSSQAATTFVVTNTNDSGAGSLRQAILDANANSGADLITFNIGSGLQTISPTTTLPEISDAVVIDGTTQPGFNGSPLIEINASNISELANRAVLVLTGGNITVKSLIINHFKDGGISIITAGGNRIEGCYIGIDATGNAETNSQGNGISVNDSPNNIIGGTTPNSRNVIAAIDFHAIAIFGFNANGNQIMGNYIGINAAGTAALPVSSGVSLATSNNIVGGTTVAARNVIGAGNNAGVLIQPFGFGTSGNVIQGNYIGTDATGSVALGFIQHGVVIFGSSDNNVIGGASPGARNVISGNGFGFRIDGFGSGTDGPPTGNVLQGNFIGVAADGFTPLPNLSQGVRLADAFNTTVGGTNPEAGNIIAFNGPSGGVGVNGLEMLGSGNGNSIRGNSIFSNGRLGIDLSPTGVTANDADDADNGPNKLQNFPLITAVTSNSGQTTITGTLNSTASTTFSIDFYSNAACDESGNGEGGKPFSLNSGLVTTDANGNGIFNVIVPAALPPGRVITATATDPSGNTSEFSPCSSNQAKGSVKFNPASLTAIEDVGFVQLTVVRSGGVGSLSVNYSTVDGSAKAGEDFVATSGILTFAEGETTKTFDVPILNNAPQENQNESFSVVLTNPTEPDAVDSPGTAIITLQDSIFIPLITLNNISVTEGNTGTTNATFTVTLSAMTGRVVTANYATSGGSAVSGVDFQPVSGTLTFNSRVTSQTVSVPVIGDTLDEFDEAFRLNLSNFINAAPVTSGLGRATILDDDASPTLSISDVSVNEGNSGTVSAVFTVRKSVVSAKAITVSYATADASASSGSDYVSASNMLTFNPQEMEKTVVVTVNGDTESETNETFLVNLSLPFEATILRGQGIGTILNDDGNTVPLQLMLDESGPDPIQAAALDSLSLLRDPFSVVNPDNWLNSGPDRNTRILLFVKNLQLGPGETSAAVVVRLVDSNNQSYDLTAEDVRSVTGVDFTQLTFRLPNALPIGKCIVEVLAHGQSSNSGTFRIRN